jgi:single-strand DNA-binding protein
LFCKARHLRSGEVTARLDKTIPLEYNNSTHFSEKESNAMSFQEIVIVGNLGRDPEMRYTPSGQAVTNFSVAANRTYNNAQGEQVKETAWFRVDAWGKLAENCNQYLKKGSLCLVTGRLKPNPETGGPRIYQGQNGPGATFEVTADTVRFLSTSNGANGGGPATVTEAMGQGIEFPAE